MGRPLLFPGCLYDAGMDLPDRRRTFRQGFWLVLGPLGGFLILGTMLPSWHAPTRLRVALVYFLMSAVSILFGIIRLNRSRDHRLSDALAIGAILTTLLGIALFSLVLFGAIAAGKQLAAP